MTTNPRPEFTPLDHQALAEARLAKDPLPRLGHVTPLAAKRGLRSWQQTNDRLRDMGDVTVLIDPAVLYQWRSRRRGRAYAEVVLVLAATLRAQFHLPYRQLEGTMRMLLAFMKLPKNLAPDYSTLSRRLPTLPLPRLPKSSSKEGVVVVIDSTGVRISEARGWHQDRNYAGDARKVKYLKLHLGCDAVTGEIVAFDITRAYGRGSGDAFVAPSILEEAAEWAQDSGRRFDGGIGDGAYDSVELYRCTRNLGGTWLAPLPDHPARGRDPTRDRHILGTKRLGEEYHDQMGYHERSTIESLNGALKRTLSLSSRAHSFEKQGVDIAWQVWLYAEALVRTPRVAVGAVT